MLMLINHHLVGDDFPIGLGRIQIERHHHHHYHYQRSASTSETVRVLTIRRRSQYLVAFLVVLCQFAVVDTSNFLPVGIILYAFGISVALEQLTTTTTTTTSNKEEQQEREMIRRRELEFRKAYQEAMFEYQVLKGRTNVRIVPIQQHGKTILYAI
jgi:diphthamide synthase subunit DPH2